MSNAHGKWVNLTWNRRMTLDLLHFAQQIPFIPTERVLHLAKLVAARESAPHKIPWTVLFAKAFARTAYERPELRRTYIPFPWPHLYEHPHSVGIVTVERHDREESYPFVARYSHPEQSCLLDMTDRLVHCKNASAEQLRMLHRFRWLNVLPWPIRRLGWWSTLNLSGAVHSRKFGTFTISSVAALGAGFLGFLSTATNNLTFGVFTDTHQLPVRLGFDHRVYDGGQAARALHRLEEILNDELVAELRSLTPQRLVA